MIDLTDPPSLSFATTKRRRGECPTVRDGFGYRQRGGRLPGSCHGHQCERPRRLCAGRGIHLSIVGAGGVAGSLDGGSSCSYGVSFA